MAANNEQTWQKAEATTSQSIDTNLSTTQSTVADLLEKKGNVIFSVLPDDTIHDVVMILNEKRIGAVLVQDKNGEMQGILSERDIVRKMAQTPGKTLSQKVEMLMTKDVTTCTPEDSLVEILKQMTEKRFRHIPVMSKNKDLLGIVTIGDVVHFRLNELEYEALKMKQMIVG